MHVAATLFGCFFLALVLLDAFQTIILPRRPVGRFRITRIFFLATWPAWRSFTAVLRQPRRREQLYSTYGPFSLLLLLVFWAVLLIAAYALIYFGMHLPFADPMHPTTVLQRLRSCFYVSGTTLFTLGLGDVLPKTQSARGLLILESGTGLGFVALVIGYLPLLYSTFSDREIAVALLDARAGSPPTAGELLVRHHISGGHHALIQLLADWERWSALVLETHVSYPILCFYRSQHDNQSWLAALTAILDACALLITTVEGPSSRQAQLTFAIGRHALVDLGHVFHLEAREQHFREQPVDRLSDERFRELCGQIDEAGISLCGDPESQTRLDAIRALYEPHACALAEFLRLELPLWTPPSSAAPRRDGWKTVAELRSPVAVTDRLTHHVSQQSTATHLDDEGQHPF